MTSRWLFISLLVSSLLLSSLPLYSASFSSKWDEDFQVHGWNYLSDYHWQWLKAQGYQESLLDPDAVSHAGAMGIMQIMPDTWNEIEDRLGIIASPHNPRVNIMFGAYYMYKMVNFWKAPRTKEERLELAHASYNAGAGNILQAQIRCQNSSSWKNISPCLKNVTGKHSKETLAYVQRIRRWYNELCG